jgi:hypothetical protein
VSNLCRWERAKKKGEPTTIGNSDEHVVKVKET